MTLAYRIVLGRDRFFVRGKGYNLEERGPRESGTYNKFLVPDPLHTSLRVVSNFSADREKRVLQRQ